MSTIHVWVTKYALTTGIFERDVESSGKSMVLDPTTAYLSFYHKPDWHLTKEEAIARAEQMRVAKIASLKRSISKLEALRFS